MAMPTGRGMNNSMNDPVTRAVVDNIMGKLPTKKPQVRCNECNLEFTSLVVLDAHLQGARHAKQIRSKTILATLEESKVAFSKDQETNGLKCNPCNVYLNSIQQLQTHLNGNRHQKKMLKGPWTGEIVSKSSLTEIPAQCRPQPCKKSALLSCPPCNKFFNSESQLNAHLTSQKHADKLNNVVNAKKKRYSPYWSNKKQIYSTNSTTISTKSSTPSPAVTQPITNNFISAGYANPDNTNNYTSNNSNYINSNYPNSNYTNSIYTNTNYTNSNYGYSYS